MSKLQEVDVKVLNNKAKLPTRGSAEAAGYDLYACIDEDVVIQPGTCKKIGTGLSIALPNGYCGCLFPRSGLATKQGLRLSNCVGLADSDYRGEYIISLYNDSDVDQTITPGMRIAQLVIMPYLAVEFNIVDELDSTERGSGGFGSTGTN